MTNFADPGRAGDLRSVLLDHLDFYRGVVAAKTEGLDWSDATTSRVPSGWTVAGLINHLVHMERRWLHWGFAAEQVDEPRGDSTSDGDGWAIPEGPLEALLTDLRTVGAHTREIVEQHLLTDRAAVGGRFVDPEQTPHLQWILLHVLQEYARHTGHLDIGRELIDGSTGEA